MYYRVAYIPLIHKIPYYIFNKIKRKIDDSSSINLWHIRIGHISKKMMNKLAQLFDLGNKQRLPTYESCLKGKMIKSPFMGQVERAKHLWDLIHTDVCGLLSISVRGNYHYFVIFTNDFSRYGYVCLLRYKSEVFEKFK